MINIHGCSYPTVIIFYYLNVFTCYTETASCEDGQVRLVDGAIDQEGRVEVCHSNVWGSICGDGFDLSDAYVICKELDLGTYSELQVIRLH